MLIRLAVLAIALALPGAGLAGNAIDRATELNRAIHSGAASELREALPPLTEIEFDELAKLAGCDFREISNADKENADQGSLITFEWSCGSNTVNPGLARVTSLAFDDDGNMIGFAINGRVDADYHGDTPLRPPSLGNEREIMVDFGRAVIAGEGAALIDLVPLDAFDRARLLPYAKGSFRLSSWFEGESFRISFIEGGGQSAPARVAYVTFDRGRPIAFAFAPTNMPSNRRARNPLREYTTDRRLTVPRNTDAYNPCINC